MIYLKKVNYEDLEEEYRALKQIPAMENGFENVYRDITKEELEKEVIPTLIKHSEGLELQAGYVPDTYYFLWDNNRIVGLFKIRHYLNDFLRNGPGHMGYAILPDERGKGYAKKGLQLAIEECKNLILEDEIYFSVIKSNPASSKVILSCGGYIFEENEKEYLLRIKLPNKNKTK